MSVFMCAVLKVFWVLVVTLLLVSCSVSPRRRNTKCRFLSFWILYITFELAVTLYFCDRQFLSLVSYCTLLHRENGSFEVLCLHFTLRTALSAITLVSDLCGVDVQ